MPLSSEEFRFICQLTESRAAIVLEPGKEYLVDLRLGMLAEDEGYPSVHELIGHLAASSEPGLARKVVEAMTINETSFFRDLHPFATLRQTLLPGLLQRHRHDRCLNLWSAACSTGQEPYSLAMLLDHCFPELQDWNVRILATDMSARNLACASQGVYNQFQVNRGLPASYLVRYFAQHGSQWRLHERIRLRVGFRELNLIEPWPPLPQMDLIFLRNVLIYFKDPAKKQILARVRQQLAPGGYLFLGNAETTLHLDAGFVRIGDPGASCYQARI